MVGGEKGGVWGNCSFKLQVQLDPGVRDLAVLLNLAGAMHHEALLPRSCSHCFLNSWGFRLLDIQDLGKELGPQHMGSPSCQQVFSPSPGLTKKGMQCFLFYVCWRAHFPSGDSLGCPLTIAVMPTPQEAWSYSLSTCWSHFRR